MESNFDDAKLLSCTDSDLINHISSLPRTLDDGRAMPISNNYFAKGYARWEQMEDAVSAMKFASQLGIRVPHVHRIVHGDDFYCIMDRIPGTTLDIAWHELGWIASLRLAFQMRRIVHRLRSVVSASSGTLPIGECTSYFLEDRYNLPLRANYHHMNAFLNFWANFAGFGPEVKKTPAEHAICPRPVFTSSRPFVLTHHDLAPRNIMLDPGGQLQIIDWDLAGFYPEFFEYAGMHNFFSTGWTRFALWRWKLFTWIACGLYDKETKWLDRIRGRISRFSSGRRFNLGAGGYAAISKRPYIEKRCLD
ncbi:uncharacterized protein CPUR_06749 [Claviceps purpurea 20.1]|uniref:Aminoglycoside phosphotransferase domain-containing protein n=1 Tax=Claviceps purpurea (strain 20.1) TaxID=1111077 RepID=M1WEL9_CLAP2|nr:hypothetical protein E4U34_004185 [Claviceps purpurea]CCE32883.1 uncharacterized protein CPUR_06749 [Claviceps purpurea 20.1]